MRSTSSARPNHPSRADRTVVSGKPARDALRSGIATIAALLSPTLGPTASRVAISANLRTSAPEIVDSAGIIARRTIAIEGQYQNMGAMLLRQLVWSMHESVGDGGATAAVVAAYLIDSASRYIDAGGDATAVIRGITSAAAAALAALAPISRPIDLPAEIAHVVKCSLGDEDVALLVGEALDAVGATGPLLLRDSPSGVTECEYAGGAIWDAGSLSSSLLRTPHVSIENPYILIADYVLGIDDVIPILETCVVTGSTPLLIIAPGMSSQAIGLLVSNRDRGVISDVLAVQGPSPHGYEHRSLEEIALIVGSRLFSMARGDSLRDLRAGDFGHARQVWATKSTTGIVGGKGSVRGVQARLHEVGHELETAETEDAREIIGKRIGRLSSLTVTLRVGGRTERECDEYKERMRAGLAAGRAAMTSGAVPGGGSTLLAAARAIDPSNLGEDEAEGARLLARSLEEPFRTIVKNAGCTMPIQNQDALGHMPGAMFDVLTRSWVSPWDSGIIDPLRVPQRVIELSAGFASTILRTGTLVHNSAPAISWKP
ncbi:MAG: TCP-1/cpn60 chaperonin family protein [Thermomicrobiales bacterium]